MVTLPFKNIQKEKEKKLTAAKVLGGTAIVGGGILAARKLMRKNNVSNLIKARNNQIRSANVSAEKFKKKKVSTGMLEGANQRMANKAITVSRQRKLKRVALSADSNAVKVDNAIRAQQAAARASGNMTLAKKLARQRAETARSRVLSAGGGMNRKGVVKRQDSTYNVGNLTVFEKRKNADPFKVDIGSLVLAGGEAFRGYKDKKDGKKLAYTAKEGAIAGGLAGLTKAGYDLYKYKNRHLPMKAKLIKIAKMASIGALAGAAIRSIAHTLTPNKKKQSKKR